MLNQSQSLSYSYLLFFWQLIKMSWNIWRRVEDRTALFFILKEKIWFILVSSFSMWSNNVNKILTLSMKLLSTDGDWLSPCWSSWSSSDVDGLKQVVKHCDNRLKNAVKCRPICCQMGELFAILSLEIKSNVRMGIVAKLFSESFWSHFWNLTNKTAFLWRVSFLVVLDDQLIGNYWILKDQLLKSIHFIRHFCDLDFDKIY